MSDAVKIALIIAIVPAVASIVTAVLTLLSTRRIKLLEVNTNSIKDALVKVTGDAAYAKGLKAGREEEK